MIKHILEAVDVITLHCRDQLHQLLPLQQSCSDGVGEIYDQLEVHIMMEVTGKGRACIPGGLTYVCIQCIYPVGDLMKQPLHQLVLGTHLGSKYPTAFVLLGPL